MINGRLELHRHRLGALERSNLRKSINQGQFDRVPAELNRWVFAKGQKRPGLVARRLAEGELLKQ